MRTQVPDNALASGFVNKPMGTLISRTIMLAELRLLIAACPPSATREEYRAAVVDENVLLKPTASTRAKSYEQLRQLYILDSQNVLFRSLRQLWDSEESQPLLAVLCAVARDPFLRTTAEMIVEVPTGQPVTTQALMDQVTESFPGRLNPATLAATGRNIASSWQQSGHLTGKLHKMRALATGGPAATAYALLLGYLCGERGMGVFATLWARLIDAPPSVLDAQAFAAAQRGWLDYRRIGEIADIGFSFLLDAGDRSGADG